MRTAAIVLACALLGACAASEPPAGLLGAYQLDDGRIVSIRRSVDQTLRYRVYDDGSSGRLYGTADGRYVSGPGFAAPEPVELTVEFVTDATGTARELRWLHTEADARTAKRIGRERPVWIDSDGTPLYGRLHLPDAAPPYPGVVLVHGSGDAAGTEWFYNGDFFVANGFAVLVYDKRGSGRSEGAFTFDFERLADDAGAAAEFLANLEEIDGRRVGAAGYSQGAWVAPLAAERHEAIRFVAVNYGMIESPAEEARLEMRQILVDAGVEGQDLEAADELVRAAVGVVASGLDDGWDEFDRLREQHRDAAWLAYLADTPVGKLVNYPRWLVRLIGKSQLPDGLPWYYESTKLLQESQIPMAWLLAAEDRSAPNEQTIATLQALIEAGKPYTLTVFPNADHGMLTFTRQGNEVTYTGYVPEYFREEVNALMRLSGPGTGQ